MHFSLSKKQGRNPILVKRWWRHKKINIVRETQWVTVSPSTALLDSKHSSCFFRNKRFPTTRQFHVSSFSQIPSPSVPGGFLVGHAEGGWLRGRGGGRGGGARRATVHCRRSNHHRLVEEVCNGEVVVNVVVRRSNLYLPWGGAMHETASENSSIRASANKFELICISGFIVPINPVL